MGCVSNWARSVRLVAYFTVPAGDTPPAAAQLRAGLLEQLPDYMVPLAYVQLAALPLTANGKLDRRALPRPDADALLRRGYQAPQGELEIALARIWGELLQVDQVGREDHFFELGGHSLLAMRMVSQVRLQLQRELPLGELFANPELAAVARVLALAERSSQPAIVPVSREQPLPLSFAQQRLWFLAQLEGASPAYNIPIALRLRGRLDGIALQRALERIVARHETLRSRFVEHDDVPHVLIAPVESGLPLPVEDLRQRPEVDLATLIRDEARGAFDLAHGPLVRGRRVILAEDHQVLLLTLHHIICDGWSMAVLTRELGELYEAFRQGLDDPLPAPSLQYADYARWQHDWLAEQSQAGHGDYWRDTLAGAPALLELPGDRPRPALQQYQGGFEPLLLDETLTQQLKALSLRHGTTLFMTLLAAWAVVLARLSGQDDILIGTPVANRTRRETEGLIGFFVNTLVLRLSLAAAPTCVQLLEQARAVALGAQEHQELPFEQVVELLNPQRSQAYSPLFQVMFAWENTEPGSLQLAGLDSQPLRSRHQAAKFDLTLVLAEQDGRISGGLEYASALFDAATVTRFAGYLRQVLEGMVTQPQQSVAALPLLSTDQRDSLLRDWSGSEQAFDAQCCLHERFEAQVRRDPQAIAVRCGNDSFTYGELNARANRLAHHLRQRGVGPEVRVGLCVERSVEMLVGLLAILKAGGAYVPLDPAYPGERLAYLLQDSGVALVLTHGATRALLAETRQGLANPPECLDLDNESWADCPADDLDPAHLGLTPANLAYVIYTSGSTGQPKGVMVEHRQITRLFAGTAALFSFNRDDVWTLFHSFAFDFSVWEIWGALWHGGRLVIVSALTSRAPADFYRLLCEQRVTVLNQTPSAFRGLLEAQSRSESTHSLRCVVFGGEALEMTTLKPWFADPRNSDTQLVNMYGITEITVHATYLALRAEDAERSGASAIGRPLADLRCYLLDAAGQLVPIGVEGEIHIGGAGVARGYLNRAQLTAERFIDSPFVAGDRLYRTGDLARIDVDGQVQCLGRADDQVKIRGFRVELGEIEALLAQQPGVGTVAVLLRNDNGMDQLVTYLVPDHSLDETTLPPLLRKALQLQLPPYMVPGRFELLDSMPRLTSGKPLRCSRAGKRPA